MIYPKPRSMTTAAIVFVALFSIAAYAYFQSRNFIKGPRLFIETPMDGEATTSPVITLSGRAENISEISINNMPIFTDEEGNFREKLLLLPGYNIITAEAEDRFGRAVKKTLELIRK